MSSRRNATTLRAAAQRAPQRKPSAHPAPTTRHGSKPLAGVPRPLAPAATGPLSRRRRDRPPDLLAAAPPLLGHLGRLERPLVVPLLPLRAAPLTPANPGEHMLILDSSICLDDLPAWVTGTTNRHSRLSLEQRCWQKVDATGDCWEWIAATDWEGYGKFHIGRTSVRAYRVTWELLVGPCPEGLEPDHLCRNHSCVNPDHIEWVTQTENRRRGYAPSSYVLKTGHCKNGHLFAGNNVYLNPNGHRQCIPCRREHDRRRSPGRWLKQA